MNESKAYTDLTSFQVGTELNKIKYLQTDKIDASVQCHVYEYPELGDQIDLAVINISPNGFTPR